MMYILDEDHNVIPEPNMEKWVNAHGCQVRRHTIFTMGTGHVEKCSISTVFLGVYTGTSHPPLVFETMVFGGPWDGCQKRCATWEEAEKQHEEIRVLVRNGGMTISCN